MKTPIAIGLGIIASMVAAFFLFAIAFNTPFSELRSSFMPIYIGIVFVTLVGSMIAPGRVLVVLLSVLTLPLSMLLYVASQKPDYYIDAGALIALCAFCSILVSCSTRRTKGSDRTTGEQAGAQNP